MSIDKHIKDKIRDSEKFVDSMVDYLSIHVSEDEIEDMMEQAPPND